MDAVRPLPVIARRSPGLWRFTAAWFRRFFARHMNALRLARWGEPPDAAEGAPLVVYANHPSWWDGAVFILLAAGLFPRRESYAPIDAAMLERYRFFARIGAFGVDLGSPRGAAAFLRASREILARPDRALWVTPQGRFVDSRARPAGLRPGVAHLPELAPKAGFLPLAIEYTFWTERGAEALCAFGPLRRGPELLGLNRAKRLALLERDLAATQDRLAEDAMRRDPGRFRALVEGRPGIGGVYDLWRRLQARREGRRFDPAHGGP